MLYASIFQDKKMATKFQFSSSQIRVPVGRGGIELYMDFYASVTNGSKLRTVLATGYIFGPRVSVVLSSIP